VILARAIPAAVLLLAVTACADGSPSSTFEAPSSGPTSSMTESPTAMNVRLTVDGRVVNATLNDSASARDFAGSAQGLVDISCVRLRPC
jgi:hypothetical protein